MRIEDHPKTLAAILALGVIAAGVGAGRHLIGEPRAENAAPVHGLVCGFPLPEPPRPQPVGDNVTINVAALPAALAEGLGSGALSPRNPATLALLVELDAVADPSPHAPGRKP